MNELLFILTILLNYTGVIASFWFFGKRGVLAWMIMAAIVTNIETTKCVDLFGLSTTLGTVVYSSTFLCTDILSEFFGEKEAKRAVALTFFIMIASMVLFQMSLLFAPNETDFINNSLHDVFMLVPRITIASFFTYLISNTIDIHLYGWIKKKCKMLWVRNNGATILSQVADTVLFSLLAFAGTYDTGTLIEIMLTTLIIKVLVALCDTPFIYLARKIHNLK